MSVVSSLSIAKHFKGSSLETGWLRVSKEVAREGSKRLQHIKPHV
jgi:hypothetical protein